MKIKNHGNGFIRVYLDDEENHFLHFYSSDIPRQEVTTDIHDHEWSFTSKILQGTLVQTLWEESIDGFLPEYEVYSSGEDGKLYPLDKKVKLRCLGHTYMKVGSSYFLPEGVIHSVAPHMDEVVVTEVTRSRPLKSRPARIYVKAGQHPDNEFDNREKIIG